MVQAGGNVDHCPLAVGLQHDLHPAARAIPDCKAPASKRDAAGDGSDFGKLFKD
jgi:hypothetical protein